MAGDETRLLERLLADPEFRERFRNDPKGTARDAGFDIDDEAATNGDGAMQTLDLRESKSSFAGAMMAAAAEGFAIYELAQHVLPGMDEAHAAVMPHHWDPSEFGATGAGGPPTAETVALLENHNVTFDPSAIADLKSGKVDPRIASVLDVLAKKDKLSISAMISDHSKLTQGGSVSNHYYGRAVDVSVVDGRPVSPGNLAARRIAVALSRLPPSIRPTEIGSPWHLSGAAYFSDSEHQNHIHIGFDDPIAATWSPPPGLAPEAVPAAAPVAESSAAAAAQPVAQADAAAQQSKDASAAAAIVKPLVDPDDLQGNLDDEDAGADEQDGSNEDEPDEGGNDDDSSDDSGDDSNDDSDDDSDDSSDDSGDDSGADAPGEGSNGEDANDDSSSDDASDGSSGASSSSDPSDNSADGSSGSDLGDIASTYPGDNAPQTKIAAWMASAAEKRGIPPELPVMAGLVESSLRNLDYGDADSIGFFQMRVSIWDHGQYAGYGHDPEKQLQWFLDQAEAVKKQRLARGESVTDQKQYGDWVADIERPAAQYRGRYQLRLDEARQLLGKS
jgi:hypothetical protein